MYYNCQKNQEAIQLEEIEKFTQQYASKLSIKEMNPQFKIFIQSHQKKQQLKFDIVDQNYYNQIKMFLNLNITINDWNTILFCINSDDILQKHFGYIGLRKLLSFQNNPPVQQIIDAGLVPYLIKLAQQSQYFKHFGH